MVISLWYEPGATQPPIHGVVRSFGVSTHVYIGGLVPTGASVKSWKELSDAAPRLTECIANVNLETLTSCGW